MIWFARPTILQRVRSSFRSSVRQFVLLLVGAFVLYFHSLVPSFCILFLSIRQCIPSFFHSAESSFFRSFVLSFVNAFIRPFVHRRVRYEIDVNKKKSDKTNLPLNLKSNTFLTQEAFYKEACLFSFSPPSEVASFPLRAPPDCLRVVRSTS